ncbi:hypothetical protein V5799_029825 [Amblyomma americanum]|uniref:Uncharacterized protein n=1 Tax=Amblyomma americanum TaxID=6943 RepID=A0AAQ4EQ63_AMBAM
MRGCVTARHERDVDVSGFYVRFSDDLDPKPELHERPAAYTTGGSSSVSGSSAVAPPKPPRRRYVPAAVAPPTAFPLNWSSSRGRPDYTHRFRRSDPGPAPECAETPSQIAAEVPRRLLKVSTRPPTPFAPSLLQPGALVPRSQATQRSSGHSRL